jgi:DNA-nicking Smr family endonuclease
MSDEDLDNEPAVKIPINGILDLHTFAPREVKDLINDYIEECLQAGLSDIRIIHGKGKGILRDRVYSILKRHSMVESFVQAPLEAGGWGAVLVKLKTPPRCQ